MRSFLSAILKDNVYLFKGVMTGIYRVAKENIFSGLNNLSVETLLDEKYAPYFGLTEAEVQAMFTEFGLSENGEEAQQWYNGYLFGDNQTTYNPWSILNYVDRRKPQPYWVNTSSNELIIEQIHKNNELEIHLPLLLEGRTLLKVIKVDTALREIKEDPTAVWSLLVFAGYLKARFVELNSEKDPVYELRIPNIEVRLFFRYTVAAWLRKKTDLDNERVLTLMDHLLNGDTERFIKKFRKLVEEILSYHDIGGKEPEKVYKVFVLGLLTLAIDGYQVKSERESGLGRYDVAIYPKDVSKFGAILEFKRSDDDELEEMADEALAQIERKHYDAGLRAVGVTHILKLGIAIHGKTIVIRQKRDG